jgi:hypothetical protein
MSERRSTGDTLVLPFAVGLFVGGAVTGWVCLALGLEKQLLAMGAGAADRTQFFSCWLFDVVFYTLIGLLFEIGVISLISAILPFPLSSRLSPAGIFVLGIAAASACTIASCLTIDLSYHKFQKGPDPPFPSYIFWVCVIAPLLLVKRSTARADESGASDVDQSPVAGQEPHVLAKAAIILTGAIIGAALFALVHSRWPWGLFADDVAADIVVGGILGGLVGTGVAMKRVRPSIATLVIGAAAPHAVYRFNGGAGAYFMATAVGAVVGWAVGRLIERWKFR